VKRIVEQRTLRVAAWTSMRFFLALPLSPPPLRSHRPRHYTIGYITQHRPNRPSVCTIRMRNIGSRSRRCRTESEVWYGTHAGFVGRRSDRLGPTNPGALLATLTLTHIRARAILAVANTARGRKHLCVCVCVCVLSCILPDDQH